MTDTPLGGRILVVEDEAIVARDIEATLARAGYEVAGVHSTAASAIAGVNASRPELVLMDVALDGPFDGIDAAAAIRSQHDVGIVYLTAHADPGTVDRAKRTRPMGYVVKPFEDQELLAAVEVALFRRRAEKREQRTSGQDARAALVEAREDAARRLARELHDEAGQLLTGLHLALHDISLDLQPEQQERVRSLRKTLDRVQNDLRRIAHEMRPLILDDLGLDAALQSLVQGVAARSGLRVEIAGRVGRRLPQVVEIALYRGVQEALANAVRHAHARTVKVALAATREAVRCAVRDDGNGFDPDAPRPGRRGLGLLGLQERLDVVHGTLRIQSQAGFGTEILIAIPLTED
jgi:signal transduction histidine kinase